jgi:hypothetical protein
MGTDATQERQKQAHALLDLLPIEKLDAVVHLLQVMTDPLSRALANAPSDDEPVSTDEAREIAASRDSLAQGKSIPHEEVLAEFGLSQEDFERMGRAPLEPDPHCTG